MVFWGMEVQPGELSVCPMIRRGAKIYITQATLGDGPTEEKCILLCAGGRLRTPPIFLCSLPAGRKDSCPLNLEIDDEVIFSVAGERSIHISGFVRE
ncbi:hypothetical protein F0562_026519 [Nyssa sinensis]|uniref:Nucleoplasmin-like domain-containing protein n=1 Tax=Nyssa sinensis TaxID=561372 RepID=A0A5J5BDK7_9ASTE|nr:hypothetical protein F0562_026519 [Nyssa sinensis]